MKYLQGLMMPVEWISFLALLEMTGSQIGLND